MHVLLSFIILYELPKKLNMLYHELIVRKTTITTSQLIIYGN